MKNLLIFAGVFLLIVLFGSCRKTYSDPLVPDVFNLSPVETGYMELNTSCFLPLPDNTFLVSVKSTSWTFLDKEVFLHYDANFSFIDSTYFSEDLFFGNGVESNGSIFNVFLQTNYERTKFNYTLLETDYNYKRKEQSGNLLDSFQIQPYKYNAPKIVLLQNGTLVTAITSQVNGKDISVVLAAFNQGLHSKPIWKNDSVYSVNAVNGTNLVDMGSDGNTFYVLTKDNSNTKGILRKHDENGNLIWKKELLNFYGKRILVQNEKVVLYNSSGGMLYYDKDGNLLGTNKLMDFNLVGDDKGGFIGLDVLRGYSTIPDYSAKITKYNTEMLPIKTRVIGNGDYHDMVLGKLHDGTYVLVVSMKIQNHDEKLVFYKLDADLNYINR